ncbi:MAG: hypothetical protein IPG84_10255 [Betaproteobacteria bacterium]|nr:hypothetical protein [Betaproteobacteria bacterium]
MNRLRPGIAPTLFALATLLAAPAVPAAALSADCGPPPAGAMCLDGPWFEFATMKIDLAQGEVRSRYEVTVGAGRDLKVSLEESSPYRRGRADAILIDGEVLATKSDGSLPGEGVELLNDPLLAAQDVASLLQAALPRGPGSVAKATRVRATGTRILATNTPSMSSYYGPPWTVEGSVTPTGKREYAFDLTFSFRIAQPDGTVTAREHKHRYTGRASYPAKRPRIPDATSLVGWKLDSPSREAPAFKSLGEARRALGIAPPK